MPGRARSEAPNAPPEVAVRGFEELARPLRTDEDVARQDDRRLPEPDEPVGHLGLEGIHDRGAADRRTGRDGFLEAVDRNEGVTGFAAVVDDDVRALEEAFAGAMARGPEAGHRSIVAARQRPAT